MLQYEIISQEEFNSNDFGYSECLTNLGGCTDDGKDLGLGTWAYYFDIEVEKEEETQAFKISFETAERVSENGACSGYELSFTDDSEQEELIKFCDYDDSILDELESIATHQAKEELNRLLRMVEDGELIILFDDLGKVIVYQKIEFQEISYDSKEYRLHFSADGKKASVEVCNIHEGTGKEIDWYIVENSCECEDNDLANRIDKAIYNGESDDNKDLELYIYIRDFFETIDFEQ